MQISSEVIKVTYTAIRTETRAVNVRRRPLAVLFFTILLLISATVFSLETFADAQNCRIDSIMIGKERSELKISAVLSKELVASHKHEKLYLFELRPSDSIDALSASSPIAEFDAETNLSLNLETFRQGIYNSYVIAERSESGEYIALTGRRYIDNPQIYAENSSDFPDPLTKKGLIVQSTTDAEYLGVGHTVITVDINDYLSSSKQENTIAYTKFGQTFYFYENSLALLDHKVKVLTEEGVNVYFNIVLGKGTDRGLDPLYINRDSESAIQFAINTDTIHAERLLEVFCEYFAERYSSDAAENGFVPAYILGYEVNSGRWNYAGQMSLEEYTERYASAFRILYTAVKSHCANAKIFTSVSNVFNNPDFSDEASEGSRGAKAFLDLFALKITAGGELPWALAINPYPSDPSDGRFWNDPLAVDSPDTEYLTMKNLNVLSDYMRTENLNFEGRVRDIIISEFGIGGNGDDAQSSDLQAGAYAFAYAIADTNEDIDAFIYYRHMDFSPENFKFGLWSTDPSTGLPLGKKAIYGVFRNIDTEKCGEGLQIAKAFTGNEIYDKYLSGYTPKLGHIIMETTPTQSDGVRPGLKEKTVYDLTLGSTYGFYPSNNAEYIELRPTDESYTETALYAKLSPRSVFGYCGISNNGDSLTDGRVEYLTVNFTPITPGLQTVTVMLRLDGSANGVRYSFEGVVQQLSNSNTTLTFRVADFMEAVEGNVSSVKLLYKPSDISESGEYGLWLKKVSVLYPTGLSTALTVILYVLASLLIIAAVGALLLVRFSKPVQNSLKGFFGKRRSKLLNFLRNKKIISPKRKKKKGARATPKAGTTARPEQDPAHRLPHKAGGPKIVNGRVVTPRPDANGAKNASSYPKNFQNRHESPKHSGEDHGGRSRY